MTYVVSLNQIYDFLVHDKERKMWTGCGTKPATNEILKVKDLGERQVDDDIAIK